MAFVKVMHLPSEVEKTIEQLLILNKMKKNHLLRTSIYVCFALFVFSGCKNKANEVILEDTSNLQSCNQVIDTSMLVDNLGVVYKPMDIDTVINLSYKGIEIGKSVKPFIGKAIPEHSHVDSLGDYCMFSFTSTIQVDTKEYPTKVEVYCINDTIVLLNVIVEKRKNVSSDVLHFTGHTELINMYSAKYGTTIDYIPSDFLMTYLDTNDSYSIAKRFDKQKDDWCYDKDKYYTYHYSVWGIGSKLIILTREVYHFDGNSSRRSWSGEWELPVETWTTNDRVFLTYGDNMAFARLVKGKTKWESYCKRQQEIQDSTIAENKRRMDSIKDANTRKRILHDANQI